MPMPIEAAAAILALIMPLVIAAGIVNYQEARE